MYSQQECCRFARREISVRFVILGLILISLAACGGTNPPPTVTLLPTDPVSGTTSAERIATLAASCTRDELEAWLQASNTIRREFFDTFGAAVNALPAGLDALIEELAITHGRVQALTVPACATDHAAVMNDMMTQTLETLRLYRSGNTMSTSELGATVNTMHALLQNSEAEMMAVYMSMPMPQ
jgi:hypothetical protein